MGLNDGSKRSHPLAGPVPILPIDDKSATEDVLVLVPCGAQGVDTVVRSALLPARLDFLFT